MTTIFKSAAPEAVCTTGINRLNIEERDGHRVFVHHGDFGGPPYEVAENAVITGWDDGRLRHTIKLAPRAVRRKNMTEACDPLCYIVGLRGREIRPLRPLIARKTGGSFFD